MPEPWMIRISGQDSPAAIAADEKRYPLARILDQIDALQLTDRPKATALATALRAPEAVLRYWGAVGALRAATLPDMTVLLADPESVVRLATAEVILRRGDNHAAWTVVEAGLREARAEDRLFAVNVVARIPTTAPAGVRTLLAGLAASTTVAGGENYLARASEILLQGSR